MTTSPQWTPDSLAYLGKTMVISSASPTVRNIIELAREREETAIRGGDYMHPQPNPILNAEGLAALNAMNEKFNKAEAPATLVRGLTGKEHTKRKSRNKLASASRKRNR